MSKESWKRVKQLFDRVVELPEAERQAYLEAECADEPEVLAELLELLAADREDAFLEREAGGTRIIGQRFGDYLLLEELGSGGTGIVYRARQEGLDREVALKVMPHHLATDLTRVHRFEREAKAAASLRHPGIAPIHDYGSHRDATGTHHYFSMELVPGHDLAHELELQATSAGILPSGPGQVFERAVAEVVQACARALAHAHEQGVVHRDVKPNNIVLEPSGEPRLVDFGLARDERLGSITVTDAIQGTPYYMSPEQARALSDRIDERTDVYSLGVVLYELLSRSKPFTGRTSREVLDKIVVREPVALTKIAPKVPRDLAVVCAKAMEKRPEDRYQSAEEFADDLGRFLAGEPILARPPGLARRLTRRAARHRQPLTAALAVVITVLAIWGGSEARAYLALPGLQLEVLFADPDLDLATVVDAQGALSVTAIRLDPYAGVPLGERRDLGQAEALDGFRLPEGTWRLRVALGDFEPVELDRRVVIGEPVRALRPRFLEPADRPELLTYEAGVLAWSTASSEVDGQGSLGLSPMPGSTQGEPVDLGSFAVEPFEVSLGRFRAYLEESLAEPPELWESYNRANQDALDDLPDELPAVLLSYEDAQGFAEWYGMRLPYATELEFATRGPDWRKVPWEGDPEARRANIYRTTVVERVDTGTDLATIAERAEAVDSRPEAATPEGLHHGLGNVAELTYSFIESPGGGSVELVVYGGAWDWSGDGSRLPAIMVDDFGSRIGKTWAGFRCARSR